MTFRLICAAALLVASHAASAGTFNYVGEVTSGEINSGGGTSFGTTGDAVIATLGITAAPSLAIPVAPGDPTGLVDISVSSPDFSYAINFAAEGVNNGFNSSVNVSATGVFFATSSGTFTWPNEAGNTLRTVFSIDFGTALGAVPSTFGELEAAIALPTSSAGFVTNGDFLFSVPPGQVFDDYAADLRTDMAPVPGPLAGLLLLSGLGAVAAVRRR